MDTEKFKELIQNHRFWYHTIQITPDIVTPGINDSSARLKILDELGLPQDLSGKRVLDIGCRDGFFAFESEKRGSEDVLGIDYVEIDHTGFDIIRQITGSQAQFASDNVYNLSPEVYGQFDVVFFLGIFYHLRNPVLALDRIRAVMKTGGLLFVSTPVLDNIFPMPNGETKKLVDVAPHLQDIPILRFFEDDSFAGDPTNQFLPNVAALKSIVTQAEFKVHGLQFDEGERAILHAEAIENYDDYGRYRNRDYRAKNASK